MIHLNNFMISRTALYTTSNALITPGSVLEPLGPLNDTGVKRLLTPKFGGSGSLSEGVGLSAGTCE